MGVSSSREFSYISFLESLTYYSSTNRDVNYNTENLSHKSKSLEIKYLDKTQFKYSVIVQINFKMG